LEGVRFEEFLDEEHGSGDDNVVSFQFADQLLYKEVDLRQVLALFCLAKP
jgi:hypothetical protein